MKFEFKYSLAERKRLDQLNMPHRVGPVKFALIWCVCFAPTVLCLMWMQMWSILVAGGILVVMASLVPLLSRLRSVPPTELERTIELDSVGKKETCGASTSFVKWNHLDELIETDDDILFSRNQRFTVLPKRLLDRESLDSFRDAAAHWRNQPEESNVPLSMYRDLFQSKGNTGVGNWSFRLKRSDLVNAVNSNVRPVDDATFSMKDIESSGRSYRWVKILLIGLLLKLALVLILFSLPPNQTELAPGIVFLCLNPIVLLFGMGIWMRRRAVSAVPRFHDQQYSVRLFDGGWAIGNEDMCTFNRWSENSTFFLSSEFVGIRTDLGLIHVLPKRALGSSNGVWEFLDRAIRMKKDWLSRQYRDVTDAKMANPENNDAEERHEPVNPYRAPSVSS